MKEAQAQDLMIVVRVDVKLVGTIDIIFAPTEASRLSLNIINMQFLLVCG